MPQRQPPRMRGEPPAQNDLCRIAYGISGQQDDANEVATVQIGPYCCEGKEPPERTNGEAPPTDALDQVQEKGQKQNVEHLWPRAPRWCRSESGKEPHKSG